MTEDPQSDRPRNELPEETGAKLPEETGGKRAFPFLAPAIIVALALIMMLLFWLPQR